MPKALIVEADRSHLEELSKLFESEGFEVSAASSLAGARLLLEQEEFDLVVSDLQLEDGPALDLLPLLEQRPRTDLALVTGDGSEAAAVEAFRGGVVDHFTRPVDVPRLRKLLAQVRRAARLRSQVASLRGELRALGRFGSLVGSSEPMQRVYDQIQRVAPTSASVFVLGETGTGKELVAATVHELSPRAQRPFCPVNCAVVAPNLIESELFGHERGSFTGAAQRHKGVFERAHGGTLFLDEITETPLELQVKLLRALENREIQRVGGDRPLPVDVRVIAASNRDPHQAVAEGRLREDLLYRVMVFPIELPPLRERGGDVLLLAETFLAALGREAGVTKGLTPAARERLCAHDWPGNVRELRHTIERAFILADGRIDEEHLSLRDAPSPPPRGEPLEVRVGMSLTEMERRLTLATLEAVGEKKKAAAMLGISLKTLYNRLKAYRS